MPNETKEAGTTPQAPAPNADNVDALKARISEAEKSPETGKAHQTMGGGSAESEAPKETQSTPPADKTPPQDVKPKEGKDGLQQFKDEKGKVDEAKIAKSNEHLEKGIRERTEELRRNKELLSKFTKVSQALKQSDRDLTALKETPKEAPPAAQPADDEKAFLERLAKAGDDPRVLRELIRAEARSALNSETGDMRSFIEQERYTRSVDQRTRELESLIRQGNSWIVDEGLGRFNEIFDQKPYLLQSPTPFTDALRFIEAPGGGPTPPAPAAASTPVLGGGTATPPPTSEPTATVERKMETLSAEFRNALKYGDKAKAEELMKKMDALERSP